jgi:ribosome-associated protein
VSGEPEAAVDEDAGSALHVVEAGVGGADAKLGDRIVVLDVAEELEVFAYFVIVSGRNERQVNTICEEIEEWTKRHAGRGPVRIEGLKDSTWILMDYGDVLFHVFLDETREYYDLEHLWSGVPRLSTESLLARFSEFVDD